MSEVTNRLARVAEDNYPAIFHMERLLSHIWEGYFSKDEDRLGRDETALKEYARSYGFLMAQVYILSEELFRIRVDIELAMGIENDQTNARIRIAKETLGHME